MSSQSFLRFFMRRMWCATLFFIALLVGVFTASSVYYVVRISIIERHLNARTLKAEWESQKTTTAAAENDEVAAVVDLSGGCDSSAQDTEGDEEIFNYHRFIARGTLAGHTDVAGQLRTSTSISPYADSYKILVVNVPLSRQAVRNPTLPDTVPLWENSVNEMEEGKEYDGEGSEQIKASRVRVPARQRYVLQGLTAGKQYMLRLSYLGSPSVTFEMLLYQVRKSRLNRLQKRQRPQTLMEGGAQWVDNWVQGWSTTPQDTELRVFSTSATNALWFDYKEEVWLDEGYTDASDEDDDNVEEHEEVAGKNTVSGAAADLTRNRCGKQRALSNRYVPVVEVRPHALSIPIDTSRLPVVRFNIALEPLSSSFLPQVAVPLITFSAWAVVFVGYLWIYTLVSAGIAGGRLHED